MSRILTLGAIAAVATLSGCAADPKLVECLQPNRRVEVEVVGTRIALPPKPKPKPEAAAEAKPEAAAEAKPEAKPDAAPEAKPKPKKPEMENIIHKALAQGNWAFDHGASVLKDDGKKELDQLVRAVTRGVGKDTRPTNVGAIVITGHIDRTEAEAGQQALGEARAVSVRDYLIGQGMDGKLMFWESKGAAQPIPVTKFCEG